MFLHIQPYLISNKHDICVAPFRHNAAISNFKQTYQCGHLGTMQQYNKDIDVFTEIYSFDEGKVTGLCLIKRYWMRVQ